MPGRLSFGRGGDRRPSRGVFLVPSALTVGNIFLGYFAIVKAFDGAFAAAATLIIVAGVADKLDGLVARATGTTSDFGRELDSLADVITFGVAPALLSFAWGLSDLGKLGWVVAFLYLMCGALRLARFNVQTGSSDRRFFVGLPIPAAAALPVTLVLAHWQLAPGQPRPVETWVCWTALALLGAAAFLMVSRVRYFSFKDVHFGRQQRLLVVLALVGMVAVVAAWPGVTLFSLAIVYAAHGPVLRLVSHRSDRDRRAAPAEGEA